jgi:hypothetical protein
VHLPGEAQHLPARQHQEVLSPPVGLEQVLVRLVQPSVHLESEHLLLERHIHEIARVPARQLEVALPPGDAGLPQELVQETLCHGPRIVPRVEQQLPSSGVARPPWGELESLPHLLERR